MANVIALPDRFARTPKGREVEAAIAATTQSLKARAASARAALARRETQAAVIAGVVPVIGAAVAGQVDARLPTIMGYPPSLIAGGLLLAAGVVLENDKIAASGAGMAAPHVYTYSTTFGG